MATPNRIQGKIGFDVPGVDPYFADFASGGAGKGAMPYGIYPLMPYTPSTPKYGLQGFALNNPGGVMPDPRYADGRSDIMLHLDPRGRTLDEIKSLGCLSVEASDWPALRDRILTLQKQGEKLVVNLQPDGNVTIMRAADVPAGTPVAPSSTSFATATNQTRQDVSTQQAALAKAGFDPGAIDGIAGPQTKSAIMAFQQANGLKPDGVLGPQTTAALGGGNSAIAAINAAAHNVPAPFSAAPASGIVPATGGARVTPETTPPRIPITTTDTPPNAAMYGVRGTGSGLGMTPEELAQATGWNQGSQLYAPQGLGALSDPRTASMLTPQTGKPPLTVPPNLPAAMPGAGYKPTPLPAPLQTLPPPPIATITQPAAAPVTSLPGSTMSERAPLVAAKALAAPYQPTPAAPFTGSRPPAAAPAPAPTPGLVVGDDTPTRSTGEWLVTETTDPNRFTLDVPGAIAKIRAMPQANPLNAFLLKAASDEQIKAALSDPTRMPPGVRVIINDSDVAEVIIDDPSILSETLPDGTKNPNYNPSIFDVMKPRVSTSTVFSPNPAGPPTRVTPTPKPPLTVPPNLPAAMPGAGYKPTPRPPQNIPTTGSSSVAPFNYSQFYGSNAGVSNSPPPKPNPLTGFGGLTPPAINAAPSGITPQPGMSVGFAPGMSSAFGVPSKTVPPPAAFAPFNYGQFYGPNAGVSGMSVPGALPPPAPLVPGPMMTPVAPPPLRPVTVAPVARPRPIQQPSDLDVFAAKLRNAGITVTGNNKGYVDSSGSLMPTTTMSGGLRRMPGGY